MRYLIPSPWVDPSLELRARSGAGSHVPYAFAAWPSANRAIYVPVTFPCSVTLVDIRVALLNANGNYDLGLYDHDYVRLAVKGSTASSTAAHLLTLTNPMRLRGGRQYYAALVMSSVSDQTLRSTLSPNGQTIVGITQEALGATALPSTATPAAPASAYFPFFAFGVR